MVSKVIYHTSGRELVERSKAGINQAAIPTLSHEDLIRLGLNIKNMDGALSGGTTAGFIAREALESWIPGVLRTLNAKKSIDEVVGITTIGRWEDEHIKVNVVTDAGHAELYGDNSNIPYAELSNNVEQRAVVRFEQGFIAGKLEQARFGASGIEAANEKRRAAMESLERTRNLIGFKGYSSANTGCYGLVNDPSLAAAVLATANGGIVWSGTPTFVSMVGNITTLMNDIESRMGGHLQDDMRFTLVIPTGYRSLFQLREANSGVSFNQWLKETYPNLRVVSVAELKAAGAGNKDMIMLLVEDVAAADESDITGATVIQAVPTRYEVLGSDNGIKGYTEDAVMATAGVIVLRPWAVSSMLVTS